MVKIYTKTGDDGTTSLFDGTRVAKAHARVAVYGDIDELNGILGLAASFLTELTLKEKLHNIQRTLFALGAQLANPKGRPQKDKAEFTESFVDDLESEIDEMEHELKPMKSFILPGGTPATACLHVARSVCRRAERGLVALNATEGLSPVFLSYLNRLSDYLFVLARFVNHVNHTDDIKW